MRTCEPSPATWQRLASSWRIVGPSGHYIFYSAWMVVCAGHVHRRFNKSRHPPAPTTRVRTPSYIGKYFSPHEFRTDEFGAHTSAHVLLAAGAPMAAGSDSANGWRRKTYLRASFGCCAVSIKSESGFVHIHNTFMCAPLTKCLSINC